MLKFEVGQEVVLFPNRGFARLAKVEKITPTGRVRVAGSLFNGTTGHQCGGSWLCDSIEPATETNRALVAKAAAKRKVLNLKRTLNDTNINEFMTTEKLVELAAALENVLAIMASGNAK